MSDNRWFLDEKEAGSRLGWSQSALRFNRRLGLGPAYYRVGRRVLYREEDIECFLASKRVEAGGDKMGRLIDDRAQH